MKNLSLGLSTAAIGMLVVFLGLVILIACIYVMTAIMERKKKPVPAKTEQPLEVPAAEQEEDTASSDDELVAVISAAIAAVWDNQQTGFVVRRIRRTQDTPAYQRSAREEQMYSRM